MRSVLKRQSRTVFQALRRTFRLLISGLLIRGLLFGALLLVLFSFWKPNMSVGMLQASAMTSSSIIGGSFPKKLIDPVGNVMTLDKAPNRIISLTLASDEILSALLPTSSIIGVTLFADSPTSNITRHYPTEIARVKGEVESLLALEPDLVIAAHYTKPEAVTMLINANIPVLRLGSYQSMNGIKENIQLIGQATGAVNEANHLLRSLEDIEALTKRQKNNSVSPPTLLFYSPSGYSHTHDSLFGEMIQHLGLQNSLDQTELLGSPHLQRERAISLQPDIIFMTGNVPNQSRSPAQALLNDPHWQHVPATQNKRVFDLTGPEISSVSQFAWQTLLQMHATLSSAGLLQPSLDAGQP